eukprot:7162148-Prymnesium_polylepis.1
MFLPQTFRAATRGTRLLCRHLDLERVHDLLEVCWADESRVVEVEALKCREVLLEFIIRDCHRRRLGPEWQ